MVSEIVGAATNVVPLDNKKPVGLKVAVKLEDVKSSVLENCANGSGLPLEPSNGPGPMSAREMTRGGPPLGSAVSVAFIKVKAVEAEKSGGRSNIPVKFEVLNTFIPGDPFAGGVKTSNESVPIEIGAARPADEANSTNPRKTISRRFIDASLYDPPLALQRGLRFLFRNGAITIPIRFASVKPLWREGAS
jgi:hypothetical protein